MKIYLLLLFLIVSIVFCNQIAVDLPSVQGANSNWLDYSDGTPAWLTWGGMYRGVWFDLTDFFPGTSGCDIFQSEYWFYHHASYPWDTSDVYVEIWEGPVSNPATQLDQTMLTAIHYAPVSATYTMPLFSDAEFWAIANTEMSAGGWPAILGDGTPGSNSFFSDDFIIWELWADMGDYFVAIEINDWQLDNTTWGSLKVTF